MNTFLRGMKNGLPGKRLRMKDNTMRQLTPTEGMGWRLVPETIQGYTEGIGVIYNSAGTRVGAWNPRNKNGEWQDEGKVLLFTPNGLEETSYTAENETKAIEVLREHVPNADRVSEPVELDDLDSDDDDESEGDKAAREGNATSEVRQTDGGVQAQQEQQAAQRQAQDGAAAQDRGNGEGEPQKGRQGRTQDRVE